MYSIGEYIPEETILEYDSQGQPTGATRKLYLRDDEKYISSMERPGGPTIESMVDEGVLKREVLWSLEQTAGQDATVQRILPFGVISRILPIHRDQNMEDMLWSRIVYLAERYLIPEFTLIPDNFAISYAKLTVLESGPWRHQLPKMVKPAIEFDAGEYMDNPRIMIHHL